MSDIIAAISTALAPSGVGIVRLSGWGCALLADQIIKPVSGIPLAEAPNRKLVLSDLYDRQGRVIDRILAVHSRGPHSYTGEDTVELQCHGSPAVLRETMEHLLLKGARQAGPGEFTKRAFLNGTMDLTAAEAVIDLIEAETTNAAANAAGQVGGALLRKLEPVYDTLVSIMSHFHAVLDYPDEDIDDFKMQDYVMTLESQQAVLAALLATAQRGNVVKNGIKTVILGRPNAGKSSLLNALLGYDRAIVTEIPGTTRDTLEEKVRLGDLLLRVQDTAGIRDTQDVVEKMGVERSIAAAKDADLALVVIDASVPLTGEDLSILDMVKNARCVMAVRNKCDLPQAESGLPLPDYAHSVDISAKTGQGIDRLTAAVEAAFQDDIGQDETLLTNLRHVTAITEALGGITAAQDAMNAGLSPDMVLVNVEEALHAIGGVIGKSMREDITNDIFSRFCVGK